MLFLEDLCSSQLLLGFEKVFPFQMPIRPDINDNHTVFSRVLGMYQKHSNRAKGCSVWHCPKTTVIHTEMGGCQVNSGLSAS